MLSKKVFPQLRNGVRLKKFNNYALIYHYNPKMHVIIHPSHAFCLSLCTGFYSTENIGYLLRETYRLHPRESVDFVESIFTRYHQFLEYSDAARYSPPPYNPKNFIYKSDEDQSLSQREFPLSVPIIVNLNTNFNCNFECRYCYQNKKPNGQKKMNLERYLQLIREASDWGVPYIGVTGGEPCLFKGWKTLLKEIIAHQMYPIFTTNGTVIGQDDSIARELSEYGLQEITVSLDASNHELHNYITNSHNTFETVVNAIKSLVASGINVSVKNVLSPLNFNDLEEFIDFTVNLGVSEIGISYMEKGAVGSNANSLVQLTRNQLNTANAIVKKKIKTYKGICNIQPPRDGTCKWSDKAWIPCGGLSMSMSIFPSGKVSICDKLLNHERFIYGNVYEDTLQTVWYSDSFKKIRELTVDISRISPDCAACSKLQICRTSCFVDSMLVHGDPYAKHPNCTGPF